MKTDDYYSDEFRTFLEEEVADYYANKNTLDRETINKMIEAILTEKEN